MPAQEMWRSEDEDHSDAWWTTASVQDGGRSAALKGAGACRQTHFTRNFFSTHLTLCTHHIVAQGVAACL